MVRESRARRQFVMQAESDDAIRRAQERYRRATWGYVATVGARGVSFFAAIVSVPIALPYLGADRFGLWMTITSLGALLSFVGLGVGLSVMNSIAHKDGRGDQVGQ